MKIETRTIYIAEDGEEFHDRKKCEQYEAFGCVNLEPLPGYGTHRPLTAENLKWMSNGDGSVYYATATMISDREPHWKEHPAWATHLIYFGK